MIIGITGNMGAGKDTVADALRSLGICHGRLSFADKVKEAEKLIFGETDKQIRRKLLQGIGGRMRELSHRVYGNNDVWINPLHEVVIKWPRLTYVVTDVRHLDEANWILEIQKGILIHVSTKEGERCKRIEKRDDIKIKPVDWLNWHLHGSETGVADIHRLFCNHPNFKIFDNNIELEEVEPKLREMFE